MFFKPIDCQDNKNKKKWACDPNIVDFPTFKAFINGTFPETIADSHEKFFNYLKNIYGALDPAITDANIFYGKFVGIWNDFKVKYVKILEAQLEKKGGKEKTLKELTSQVAATLQYDGNQKPEEKINEVKEDINAFFNSGASNQLSPSVVESIFQWADTPQIWMTLRVSFEDLFSVVGEYYNAGDGLDYHDPTVIQDVVQAITGTVDDMKKDIENGLNADGFIYDDAPVKADITTNKNDIATNKQDIATNKGAINNSAATMQQQQRTVQANTQQTTANRNNIDTEGLRIDANEQRIATNKQEIAKNKQRSLQNFYATDKNKRDIATNKEAIANAGGGGAASSHSTLHIRKMGADDSFTIDGQNLNHWAAFYERQSWAGNEVAKKTSAKEFFQKIVRFMGKYDCDRIDCDTHSDYNKLSKWAIPGYFPANYFETIIIKDGNITPTTGTYDNPTRLDGEGYINVKKMGYEQQGSDYIRRELSSTARFYHAQSGGNDVVQIADFEKKALDPSYTQVRRFDGVVDSLHNYLRGEITYHHDSAVFRKDQSKIVVSSLGRKIDDPGNNRNKWIAAPGLVNVEVQDPASPKSILWTAATKRAAIQKGIYKVEFKHQFYDINVSGETYVRILVNGTENTDYVLTHWQGLDGGFSQSNAGKNFNYKCGGWIRVLNDNRVSLQFQTYQPANNARGSRFAHGQAYNTQSGRNCYLYLTKLDSGVEIDPTIPTTLPNNS